MATNSEITPDNIREWLPGTFPGDMAIEPLEITDELSTGRMVVDKRHLHPGGFVHGGVWRALGGSRPLRRPGRGRGPLPQPAPEPRLHHHRAEAQRLRRRCARRRADLRGA